MSYTHPRESSLLALITSFLAILLLVLISCPLAGADGTTDGPYGWFPQDAHWTQAYISCIDAVDGDTAWAVGGDGTNGTILRTDDGGLTWITQPSGTDAGLLSVSAVDEYTAWAVGTNGTILKTSDGGASWQPQYFGETRTFTKVRALNADCAWAILANGIILKTFNGGGLWYSVYSGGPFFLEDLCAVDGTTAWAVGYSYKDYKGRIIKTDNGGLTWITQDAGDVSALTGVSAVDSDTAWATGHASLLRTEDGGATWASADDVKWGTSLVAVDHQTLWLIGWNGYVHKTTDGGATWELQETNTDFDLDIISAVDSQHAWVWGQGLRYKSSLTVILRTEDGGSNWDICPPPVVMNTTDISAVDADTAWTAGGRNSVLTRTLDGGETWEHLFPESYGGFGQGTIAVAALDSNTAWSVLVSFSPYTLGSYSVARTSDGGETWSFQSTGNLSSAKYDVFACDADTAWVVGSGGGIYYTSDGSTTWTPQTSGTTVDLNAVSAADADHVWAVGEEGTILYTGDSGATWTSQDSGTSLALSELYVVDVSTLWAVGEGGTILHSDDGGANWTAQDSGTTVDLHGVSASSGHVWAVGKEGTIVHSDDGATWTPQESGTTVDLHGVSAADADHVWAVGDGGTILRTVNGGEGPPPPEVTSIAPSQAYQHTIALNITDLAGSGFQPGATVALEKGDQVIQAYDVNMVSSSQITCKIGLFGVETGSYDVVVTNPDGQEGRLAGGFTVDPPCGAGSGTALLIFGLAMGLLSLAGSEKLRRRKNPSV